MNAKQYSPRRSRPLLRAGLCLAGSGLVLQTILAADTPPEEDKPLHEYRNWLDVSVGGLSVGGDEAQFMRRHGYQGKAFIGVEDFHWEQDVGKKGMFQINGRGLFDLNDYRLDFALEDPDVGFLRGGFRQFRTWYDGSGGYFPPNGQWFSLYDEELALNRGEVWFEGGLTRPDQPQLTFSYRHQFRDGRKDSTSWGESNLTGGAGARGIVPSFWDIDEERDIFEADIQHRFGSTDVGAGLRFDLWDNNNSRNMRRRPNEAPDRHLTQREIVEGDLFNVHAFTETRFNDRLLFTTGYAFTTLDTDISGSRIYGADYDALYDPVFARRQARDEGFFALSGGSQMKQYVLNLNLMWTPWEHFTVVPSVRVEKQDQDGVAAFTETNVGNAPALAAAQDDLLNTRDRGFVDVSEALEARYTGLTNWVFYARGEWLQGEGDLKEREIEAATGVVDLLRETDSTRFTQKYSVGANWYPLRKLNLAAQYYHKSRDNDYDHRLDSTPNNSADRYPAFLREQDFDTDDFNARVTWRPHPTVTLVSRYDFQLSTIDTRADGLAGVESAENRAHVLSQSVSWSPLGRLYLQGTINYVLDETDTPATRALGTTNLVLVSANDYWNASASAGYALDEKTDLEASYFYYRADNYSDNSALTVAYGADAEEHGILAGIRRRIARNILWTARYGYFQGKSETAGGRNDYTAHLAYTSLRIFF